MFNINRLITGCEALIAAREANRDEAEAKLKADKAEVTAKRKELRREAAIFFAYIAREMKRGRQFTREELEGTVLFNNHPAPGIIPDERHYRDDIQSRISKEALDGKLERLDQEFNSAYPDAGSDEVDAALLVLKAIEGKDTVSQSALEKMGVSGSLVRRALVAGRG